MTEQSLVRVATVVSGFAVVQVSVVLEQEPALV
jgi:hypothetical protein